MVVVCLFVGRDGKVDLVIQAHEHDMEATYPLYHNITVQRDFTSPKGTCKP